MLQWIELTTKQFNACPAACEWFLDAMAEDDWWPQQILIKCPNQVSTEGALSEYGEGAEWVL